MTLHQYAEKHGLTLAEARGQLIELALTHIDARSRGGVTTAAMLSPEARSARARDAVRVRWDKAKEQPLRDDAGES
jgi:hypothetical protein